MGDGEVRSRRVVSTSVLDELLVRNLGVISEARFRPSDGLTVISGETGTGKTLLLGAVRLLLGEAPNTDLVGPFGQETVVDGRFRSEEDESVVSRVVPKEGRSASYIDGRLASTATLAERIGSDVAVIGQHDQLSLARPRAVLRLIDDALDDDGVNTLMAYREAWDRLQSLESLRDDLGGDPRALNRELELLAYQTTEIDKAGFEAGDDERLEAAAVRLSNLETLRTGLAQLHQMGGEVADTLGSMISEIRKLGMIDHRLGPTEERLEGLGSEIADLLVVLRDAADNDETGNLGEVEERLTLLGDLKRKYGSTLDDILAYRSEAGERHTRIVALLDRAESLESDLETAREEAKRQAEALTETRARAAESLANEAVKHLGDLGFEDPVMSIALETTEPTASGADRPAIVFASDSRLSAGPIGAASGGELSRLVLSLRLAAGASERTTMIFDEIDAGVGGATALALGEKLARLAQTSQVLCVTHLPQVAAWADRHLVVRRDGAEASVELVEGEERVEELTRMLAGLPDSSPGADAARELLERAVVPRSE
ncbi:MAG: AAA family ATPase [Acidimicrobiia bacterium]|nr:AAA family ATPase [Acidimicrobiia bacterium]